MTGKHVQATANRARPAEQDRVHHLAGADVAYRDERDTCLARPDYRKNSRTLTTLVYWLGDEPSATAMNARHRSPLEVHRGLLRHTVYLEEFTHRSPPSG